MMEAQQQPAAPGEPGDAVGAMASPLNMGQSQGALPAEGQPAMAGVDIQQMAQSIAMQMSQLPPDQQDLAMQNIKAQSPELAQMVQQLLAQMQQEQAQMAQQMPGANQQAAQQINMQPMPEQRAPRRAAAMV